MGRKKLLPRSEFSKTCPSHCPVLHIPPQTFWRHTTEATQNFSKASQREGPVSCTEPGYQQQPSSNKGKGCFPPGPSIQVGGTTSRPSVARRHPTGKHPRHDRLLFYVLHVLLQNDFNPETSGPQLRKVTEAPEIKVYILRGHLTNELLGGVLCFTEHLGEVMSFGEDRSNHPG